MAGDDPNNVQRALDKAANFDRLRGESTDEEKQEDYRTKAKFQRSIADELRMKLKLDDQEKGHRKRSGDDPVQRGPDGDVPSV